MTQHNVQLALASQEAKLGKIIKNLIKLLMQFCVSLVTMNTAISREVVG